MSATALGSDSSTPPASTNANDARAETPETASAPASTQTLAQRLDENLLLIRGNNTPEARKLGATRLLEIGNDEAATRLKSVLTADSPDLAAQLAVCAAIADFERPPPMLVEPLLAMLGDARPGVGEHVGRAIRRFDSAVVVGRLRPIAVDAAYARPRRLAAIRALGVLSDDVQAVGLLAEVLDDADRAVRHAALAAFKEATGAGFNDPEPAAQWWRGVSALPPEDLLKALIELRAQQVQRLRNERSELTRRLVSSAREAYLSTPEPNRPRYLQTLLSDEVAALRLLGLDLVNDLITDRREINPDTKDRIVELTTDPDAKVRLRAARIVGDLRLSGAVTKLQETMPRELDDEVRAAQAGALGRLDDLSALPALIERLSDDAPSVVGEAATALGRLLRRGRQELPEASEGVINLLVERYRQLLPQDGDLRERFLLAMASIGAPDFRSIFEEEMINGGATRIRRAAIAGVAVYEDSAAAAVIRPLTEATDPEIRLAAVEALGKCGGGADDLATLSNHLDADRESDSGIRQQAWDSFMAVAQRLPTEQRIRISDHFDKPDDKTSQRRRLELLRALRTDTARFEELSREERIDVFERIADAQLELGEYAAASASMEQAMGLFADLEDERYALLAQGSVAALLKGREDAAAMKRIGELFDGQRINGELSDPTLIVEVLRKEIKARTATAKDAAGYADARNLIDQSAEFAVRAGDSFRNELRVLRDELFARRDAEVRRLLDAMASDPDAESRLYQLGRQHVLPQLYQRLHDRPAETPEAQAFEARMVELAKRLIPDWPGYEANSTEAERRSAIESLRETIESAQREERRAANPT